MSKAKSGHYCGDCDRCTIADLNAKIEKLSEALRNIQNAYGSPNDEDEVTTLARNALAEVEEK